MRAQGRTSLRSREDRKSTRLNSSHMSISYAVFCLKKKKTRVVDGMLENKARYAMLGYLNAASPFTVDVWFRTGDAVEVDGVFFFNDTATTEIYTLSLHDALPI